MQRNVSLGIPLEGYKDKFIIKIKMESNYKQFVLLMWFPIRHSLITISVVAQPNPDHSNSSPLIQPIVALPTPSIHYNLFQSDLRLCRTHSNDNY